MNRIMVFLSLLSGGFVSAAEPALDFDRQIAPLLIHKCGGCHAGSNPKGGFDVTRKPKVLKAAELPMWIRVRDDEMPPKKPLSAGEKALLKEWVDAGGVWGTDPIDPFARTTKLRAGRDWWSLQPLATVEPPKLRIIPAGWDSHPIDAFLLAKLQAKRLKPSPAADPRVLVRRLAFDLTGLPPTFEQADTFAKNPSEAAYRKLVDDLLASPAYGEKWARHWLDLVRYGESDGFERNMPRLTAWHYRDWVISALNEDMPFDEFARLQIAGDVLKPTDPAAVKATGFLVAGVHNTVLGSNAVANETARQDELEDVIATSSQAFLGLTVQCARCHDHKFDPIPQTDYYHLAAALGGVFHGERPICTPAALEARKQREAELRPIIAALDRQLAQLEEAARDRVRASRGEKTSAKPAVAPLAQWTFDKEGTDESGKLNAKPEGGAKFANGRLVLDGKAGYAITPPLAKNLREKTLEAWVLAPNTDQGGGGVITVETESGGVFDSIVFAERKPMKWVAGSNFFHRTRDLDGPDETTPAGELVHLAITYEPTGRIRVFRNGTPYGEAYTPESELPTYKAEESRILFGKRHTGGENAYFRGEIEEARLYDKALSPAEVAASAKAGPGPLGVSRTAALAALTPEEKMTFEKLTSDRKRVAEEFEKLSKVDKVFAVTPRQPPLTHVLARGSVEKKLQVVVPAGLGNADFGLKPDAPEADRRKALANWITRPENPLFSRVIVNRLWHHHFGVERRPKRQWGRFLVEFLVVNDGRWTCTIPGRPFAPGVSHADASRLPAPPRSV